MGFWGRFFKCSVCGGELGSKHYGIAKNYFICRNCFELAGLSKRELWKNPLEKMTSDEIREIIVLNEKLKGEVGNVRNANIMGALRSAKKQLKKEERILHWVYGVYKTKSLGTNALREGLFVATSHQVFFYSERHTGFETESFPFSNIKSLEIGEGFLGNKINIIALGNRVEMFRIQNGQFNQFVDYLRNKIGNSSNVNATPPLDTADQLRMYKSLLDDGIITEEEFNLKKKELLEL